MIFTGFSPETLQFFKDLAISHNKPRFETRRRDDDACVLKPARDLVVTLGKRQRALAPDIMADPRVNKSAFRIYRDMRFSKYVIQLH